MLQRVCSFRPSTKAVPALVASLCLCSVLTFLFFASKAFEELPLRLRSHNSSNAFPSSVPPKCVPCVNRTVQLVLPGPVKEQDYWAFDWQRDSFKYGLDDQKCDIAFPGLFQDIDAAVEHRQGRNVSVGDIDANLEGNGTIRAMIFDGQLYIIDFKEAFAPRFQSRTLATLQSLYRAIIASSDPRELPNVEFALTIGDSSEDAYGEDANRPIWAFTRRAEQNDIWVMPDFGYWSFPEVFIGAQPEVMRRIHEVEEEVPFPEKTKKLVWRGNLETMPAVRGALLNATESKPWADVRPIVWGDPDSMKNDLMSMEDHCRYMFIAYTEGRSWSGRLKYFQNCRSVIVAHKMQWIQPANYLLKSDGPDQNFVQVERDFSDLEDAMTHLLENPEDARRIAVNNVRTFRQRYVTPAAEACYWRKLIRGWSRVSFKPEFYRFNETTGKRAWRGVPFESFALMKDIKWS